MDRIYTLNSYVRSRFACKLYKLSLDGGFTCPNRDGKAGTGGCIFCSGRGSGDFAESTRDGVYAAIERAKLRVQDKNPGGRYISYFQSFTSTYAPVERLRPLFTEAIMHPDIELLSVATRPDCLGEDVAELLGELNRIKPVWVELGLQTVNEETVDYIRRGYGNEVYFDAVKRLRSKGIDVITHMIIGLPGEDEEMIYRTARAIGDNGASGVKFQLLHVLKSTDLAADYAAGRFRAMEMEEYFRILSGCIERIPPDMVIHRLTGDGDKRELIAPLWSGDKKRVLNSLNRYLEEHDVVQGRLWTHRR